MSELNKLIAKSLKLKITAEEETRFWFDTGATDWDAVDAAKLYRAKLREFGLEIVEAKVLPKSEYWCELHATLKDDKYEYHIVVGTTGFNGVVEHD